MRTLMLGLAANAAGAHTQELFDGFREAQNWTGISCTYYWAEDGRDPSIAERAAKKFVAKDVPLVIGHLSAAASLTAARIYRAHDIALVAPATSHPELNAGNWPGIVRVCGTDLQTARVMLNAAEPAALCAILCQDQIFGWSLAGCLRQALAERGAPAALHWVYDETDALPPIPSNITEIFVTGIHEYCATVVRALRAARSDLKITLGDDCLTPNFLRLAGRAANGVTVICPTVPAVEDVSQGYKPAAVIGTAIALQAMAVAPQARGMELGHIMRSRKWPTPYGDFGFDGWGDIIGLETGTYTVEAGVYLSRRSGSERTRGPEKSVPAEPTGAEAQAAP